MSTLILQYYAWLSGLNAWFAPLITGVTDSLNIPLVSALLFGLLGATAPCQLSFSAATLTFLARRADDPAQMWRQTLAFVAGKALVYTFGGGALVLAGLSLGQISGTLVPVAGMARKAMGPLLILVGLVIVGVVRLSFSWGGRLAQRIEVRAGRGSGWLPPFGLGVAFSFTFCPTLFWLFFGLTLPLAIASPGGVVFPGVFALGTVLPVLLISALLASGVVNIGAALRRFRLANIWVQRLAGLIFVLMGLNELVLYWLI